MSITAGNFRDYSAEQNPIDDIAVAQSVGDSNPDLIGKILIFPSRNINGTNSIGYPTHLAPLNYDIRAIDTNENYNATTNAHNYFRPNTIAAGNFDTDDTLDELALIARTASSSNPNDYYRILVLDDFGFPTNPDALYSIKTTLLPSSYRKAIHAIAVEDFNDDGNDDILVYGSNGYGNNDKLDTNQNARMFLYSGYGTGNFSYAKTVLYNERQVIAATAGRYSRPEYAFMEDNGNLYFPLWWYHHIIGNHASSSVKQQYLNDFNEFVSEGIMNGANLYAHSNWVKPTDTNITTYLNNSGSLKINLGTQIKQGFRYLDVNYWSDISSYHSYYYTNFYDSDYIGSRVNTFKSRNEIWGWYLEDEPSSIWKGYSATYYKLGEAYDYIKGQDSYNKRISIVDNFVGWYEKGIAYFLPNIDVAMWEDYPNSYGSSNNEFSFRAQTSQLVADLAYRAYKFKPNVTSMKPIIGVLQAEEGTGIVESDLDDYRYMIYTSLIHGSRGLAFYSYHKANSAMKANVNSAITQLKNLNIPEIISSEVYKGVSTQFENTYSTGQGYQKTAPYSALDKDSDSNTPQYFHQIIWINHAFRKQPDGYYLLMVNDLNLTFSSNNGGKDKVIVTLPVSITKLEVFNFNNNSWNNAFYSGKTFSADFQPWEVKFFRINGVGTPPIPHTSKIASTSNVTEVYKKYSFNLSQNYPNPFNPSTSISYEIEHQDYVTLSVYNSIGQLVTTLVDGVKTAGIHQVIFNTHNLSSGIYFYRLASSSRTIYKKMLLVK